MKIVEAIWERENIGSNVLEITVEKSDHPTDYDFINIPPDYDYLVVKVPVNMTEFNWHLGGLGYTMIETQLRLSKDIKELDFNDRYLKKIIPYLSYKTYNRESDINEIINRITPKMFITDRISLDPLFGPNDGCKRYRNYIRNSFAQEKLEIIGFLFKEKLVGFEMHTIANGVCYGKLGGLFDDANIPGLGLLTSVAPLLYTNAKYGATRFVPDISTNNISVLNLYDYFHFKVESLTYVFVKHNIK